MTRMRRFAALALTSATLALAMAPSAEAQYRRPYHRGGWAPGGAVAAGVLGGAMLGAALAAPRYYSAPAYAAPVYEPVYPTEECYRDLVGYNRWGRPIYRTVCE